MIIWTNAIRLFGLSDKFISVLRIVLTSHAHVNPILAVTQGYAKPLNKETTP